MEHEGTVKEELHYEYTTLEFRPKPRMWIRMIEPDETTTAYWFEEPCYTFTRPVSSLTNTERK